MSEKRFELRYDLIQEINAKGEIIDVLTDDEVVDLLNHLSKENEQLKQQLDKIPPKIKEVWLK